MANMIRPLKADEIDVRISSIPEKGLTLVLYKNARVDQEILDEVFGPLNWQRTHVTIGGNLFCSIKVFDNERNIWIEKQDVGTAGLLEKEKSEASDSFKRAAVNWGIGRELYTLESPIWVSAGNVEILRRGEKFYCNERFSVSSIDYNENREISALTIVNGKGQCVYQMLKKWKTEKEDTLTSDQKKALYSELQRTGISKTDVYRRYKVQDENEISQQLYTKMMAALSKTRSAGTAA